jgi:hypothetical protein
VIGQASGYRRGDPERLVDAGEAVVDAVQRNRRTAILYQTFGDAR